MSSLNSVGLNRPALFFLYPRSPLKERDELHHDGGFVGRQLALDQLRDFASGDASFRTWAHRYRLAWLRRGEAVIAVKCVALPPTGDRAHTGDQQH